MLSNDLVAHVFDGFSSCLCPIYSALTASTISGTSSVSHFFPRSQIVAGPSAPMPWPLVILLFSFPPPPRLASEKGLRQSPSTTGERFGKPLSDDFSFWQPAYPFHSVLYNQTSPPSVESSRDPLPNLLGCLPRIFNPLRAYYLPRGAQAATLAPREITPMELRSLVDGHLNTTSSNMNEISAASSRINGVRRAFNSRP